MEPDRPLLTIEGRTVTRAEFDMSTNRRAHALAEKGVQQFDFVTIALPNCLEFYEFVVAVWKLGATPNPVSPRLPKAELRDIVEIANPRLVICQNVEELEGVLTVSPELGSDVSLPSSPLPEKKPEYWKAMTSGGSTGRPKLIIDHQEAVWIPDEPLPFQRSGATYINPGPLYHNAPFHFMFSALFGGGHVVEMTKFDPLKFLELVEQYRVNWVVLVPTMMRRIWAAKQEQERDFDVSSLEFVLHTASACPVPLKENWINWLGPEKIFEVYSGTERSGVCFITGQEWLEHKGSVGKPVGCKMKVLDEDGNEVGPGEIGEIYFLAENGKNSTYHYVGAEAKTQGDWESLGDLGYVDEDGYLYIADRRVDMIVSGGANIFPAEVEGALEQHPGVASVAVIGLPDEDLGNRVHAIVQPKAEWRDTLTEDVLREHLSSLLVLYKTPRTYEFVEDALRDDAGKVRRSKLREERMSLTAKVQV
ncbi:AMP-binding protein [Kineobactrum salinum]|nr:AMP-binding protein [Kineobactrum salinum]